MKLRSKFLTLLVILPSLCLGLFLFFAYTVFVNDKQATLLESHFQLLNAANLTLNMSKGNDKLAILNHLRTQEGFESLIAVDSAGRLLFEPTKSLEAAVGSTIYQKLTEQTAQEGGFQSRDLKGDLTLVSYLKVNTKPEFTLILTASTAGSHRAALLFLIKAGLTFIALLSISSIISILFSNRLTVGISSLSLAMKRFGAGDLKVETPIIKTKDEVADMSKSFSIMRQQINSLIGEREASARLEAEFSLAGELQKRFLAPESFNSGPLDFYGYYEPAKFAGGDWWFYFQIEQKFIFMIGDVTGHGLNSAMMTGVARSALSIISTNFDTTSKAMGQLNKVFCEVGRGELNMTCFLGCLDTETGAIEYSNASHEMPFVLPALDQTLGKNDFGVLQEEPNRRLGENPDSQYAKYNFQLHPNDLLFVYSDGLIDVPSEENSTNFGERNLMKTLGKDHLANLSARELIKKVENRIANYRGTKDLPDDLSFFAVKWKGLS